MWRAQVEVHTVHRFSLPATREVHARRVADRASSFSLDRASSSALTVTLFTCRIWQVHAQMAKLAELQTLSLAGLDSGGTQPT